MVKIKKKGYQAKEHQEQEIVTLAHKVSALLSEYRKQLMLAASAAVAVLVIAGAYSLVRSQQEQKAAPLLNAAYEYYSPSGGMNADYQKALGLFRDIMKQYPNTKSGAIAHYYIGNSLVNMGQMDEALKEYQAFIKRYTGEKLLLGVVYQRMGYVYNALGRQADAVKAFEQSESVTGPGLASLELARLYETAGNHPESQKKYKLAKDSLAGTALGMEAMGKIQKIATVQQPPAAKETK